MSKPGEGTYTLSLDSLEAMPCLPREIWLDPYAPIKLGDTFGECHAEMVAAIMIGCLQPANCWAALRVDLIVQMAQTYDRIHKDYVMLAIEQLQQGGFVRVGTVDEVPVVILLRSMPERILARGNGRFRSDMEPILRLSI